MIRQYDPVLLHVQRQFDSLLAIADDVEALYKIPRSSNFTEQLKKLNLRRGNALTGIKYLILGHTYSTDSLTKMHAHRLAESLENFRLKSPARAIPAQLRVSAPLLPIEIQPPTF